MRRKEERSKQGQTSESEREHSPRRTRRGPVARRVRWPCTCSSPRTSADFARPWQTPLQATLAASSSAPARARSGRGGTQRSCAAAGRVPLIGGASGRKLRGPAPCSARVRQAACNMELPLDAPSASRVPAGTCI